MNGAETNSQGTHDRRHPPRVAYVMPTHDRPEELRQTLAALGALPAHDAQVIVVDNASEPAAAVTARLENGLRVECLRRAHNEGAAARNTGAMAADSSCEWIVMLDDDSAPTDLGFLDRLAAQPTDVLAVSADIALPEAGRRESGGLPEVFIGCGVAFRREAFVYSGGYDPRFGYYAEEYDLAARLLLAGGRVRFEPDFRVAHRKTERGRDMDLILGRLVRNNGWVMQRYAPDAVRREMARSMRARYRAIAAKERAIEGFGRGLRELRATVRRQWRTPLPTVVWDRFTGLAHAREALAAARDRHGFDSAAIIEPGKHAEFVEQALRELGVRIVEERDADTLVVGTLSPGPGLDAVERLDGSLAAADRPVVLPWEPGRLLATAPLHRLSDGSPARAAPARVSPVRRAA